MANKISNRFKKLFTCCFKGKAVPDRIFFRKNSNSLRVLAGEMQGNYIFKKRNFQESVIEIGLPNKRKTVPLLCQNSIPDNSILLSFGNTANKEFKIQENINSLREKKRELEKQAADEILNYYSVSDATLFALMTLQPKESLEKFKKQKVDIINEIKGNKNRIQILESRIEWVDRNIKTIENYIESNKNEIIT